MAPKNKEMKKGLVFILLFMCAVSVSTAQDNNQLDSLLRLQQETISSIQAELKNVDTKLARQSITISTLSEKVKALEGSVDNLSGNVSGVKEELTATTNLLEEQIKDTKDSALTETQDVKKSLSATVLWGIICGLVILAIALLLHFRTKKKLQQGLSSLDEIHKAQEAIQSESVKLDSKVVDLLDAQIKAQRLQPEAAVPDHSLALKVADEIVRIETNLSRMDSSVKGYKQLSASVRRIKDNFVANGYEFIDMLGKPYNEGIKAVVNFVTDEDLNEGEQIITGIIKPQINFNGVMIQAAQITVSQNI